MSADRVPPAKDEIATAAQRVLAARNTSSTITLPRLESVHNGVYADDTETLRLISALVESVEPRHVIVFGCDATCELLALLGFTHGRLAVTVFEHDPWAAEAWINTASPYAVNYRWFSFCVCPLIARQCGDEVRPVYDDGMTLPVVPYPADLIVINGPPDTLGGRAGIIFQALKYARAGSIVLALDARPGEAEMFVTWQAELQAQLQFAPPGLLERHLAFIVREPLAEPFRHELPHAHATFRGRGAA